MLEPTFSLVINKNNILLKINLRMYFTNSVLQIIKLTKNKLFSLNGGRFYLTSVKIYYNMFCLKLSRISKLVYANL